MLEVANVRQVPDDYFRRWFGDAHFDLIAWYEPDGSIHGFQLTYDKGGKEKTVTWLRKGYVSHHRVDSGEDNGWANRAPILITSDGRSEMARVLTEFMASADGISPVLKALVGQKLREYGGTTVSLWQRLVRIVLISLAGIGASLAVDARIRHLKSIVTD